MSHRLVATAVRPEAADVQPEAAAAASVWPEAAPVRQKKRLVSSTRHKTTAGCPKHPEVTPVQLAAPAVPDMCPSTCMACEFANGISLE
ncbi:hypothetical protein PBY51_006738 [Eleginops maclovinus]|uniref:Uncharacterized protein n=1 Tax=Eleginops maclovinus TaxID=56733 RepID=A0AAN7X029_ELEMC|nr:hypothetical protein PBY51_006738 [Eleginops maclovinus]